MYVFSPPTRRPSLGAWCWFLSFGKKVDLHRVWDIFISKYQTTVRGVMGSDIQDAETMTMLNEDFEWCNGCINLEADPRHMNIVLKEMGLEYGKVERVQTSQDPERR